MLFVLYGAISGVGKDSRLFFEKSGVKLIKKYNYAESTPKLTSISEPRNFVYDKHYFDEHTIPFYRYKVGDIEIGIDAEQLMDAVSGNGDYLLSISSTDIAFLSKLKVSYKDNVKLIYVYIDNNTLWSIIDKFDISEDEKKLRYDIGDSVKKAYNQNKSIFDYKIIYGGENSDFNTANLFDEYELILTTNKSRENQIIQLIKSIKSDTSKIIKQSEEINEKLDVITSYIMKIENIVAKEKEYNITSNMTEAAYSDFINNTASKISEIVCEDISTVDSAEKQLIHIFDPYWEALDAYTKKSLLSAKVLLNNCKRMDYKCLDFSGIIIAATSALENEIKIRLFSKYQDYLSKKCGVPSKETWPQSMIYVRQDGKILKNRNFTLGSVPYILGYKSQLSENDETILDCYIKTILNDMMKEHGIDAFRKGENDQRNFIEKCEDVRLVYRNAAAHTEPVDYTKAERCFEVIIGKIKSNNDIVKGMLYELAMTTSNFLK